MNLLVMGRFKKTKSKGFQIVNPSNYKEDPLIDWTQCCLCQTNDNSNLIRPQKFDFIVTNIIRLHKIEALPFDIDRLNDGSGVLKTLQIKRKQSDIENATYHIVENH